MRSVHHFATSPLSCIPQTFSIHSTSLGNIPITLPTLWPDEPRHLLDKLSACNSRNFLSGQWEHNIVISLLYSMLCSWWTSSVPHGCVDTVGLEGLAGDPLQCDFPGKPRVAMGTVDGDLPVWCVWHSEVFTWPYREDTIPL